MIRVRTSGRGVQRGDILSGQGNGRILLLALLMAGYAIAGGASRSDELGQVIVRGMSSAVLFLAVLLGSFNWRYKALWALTAAIAGLAILQLIPLPQSFWGMMPGHDIAGPGAIGARQWRSISQVPGATYNFIYALLTPVTILVLACGGRRSLGREALGIILLCILASSFVALCQAANFFPDNVFINETAGAASGFLANRNHQALLLAIGMVLLPGWVAASSRTVQWRIWVAAGGLIWLILMVLATGSRAGIVLALLALAFDALLLWLAMRERQGREWWRSRPRWMRLTLLLSALVVVALPVGLSLVADRALSIDRAIDLDAGDDIRIRAAPIVLETALRDLPFGSGLGGFDPTFRTVEPVDLLKPTYFNHAHNEFLEIALDAGLPGLALLALALLWWIVASIRAWRAVERGPTLARLGSMVLLLMTAASLFDYPLRTPLMAAIATIAAIWLSAVPHAHHGSTLPRGG